MASETGSKDISVFPVSPPHIFKEIIVLRIGRGCLQKATAFSPSRTISCMGVSPISSLSQVNSRNMSKVISDSGFSVYKALPLLFRLVHIVQHRLKINLLADEHIPEPEQNPQFAWILYKNCRL